MVLHFLHPLVFLVDLLVLRAVRLLDADLFVPFRRRFVGPHEMVLVRI